MTQLAEMNLLAEQPANGPPPNPQPTYHKIRQSLLQPTKGNRKLINTIRKSTVLCIIAILSTWMFVLGTAYILRQCGFFLTLDGVINSLCLVSLFKFSNAWYSRCCYPLERCCIDVICCCYCCKPRNAYGIARQQLNTSHSHLRHSSQTEVSVAGVSSLYIVNKPGYDTHTTVVVAYHDHHDSFSFSALYDDRPKTLPSDDQKPVPSAYDESDSEMTADLTPSPESNEVEPEATEDKLKLTITDVANVNHQKTPPRNRANSDGHLSVTKKRLRTDSPLIHTPSKDRRKSMTDVAEMDSADDDSDHSAASATFILLELSDDEREEQTHEPPLSPIEMTLHEPNQADVTD
eukprot:CAMPEP_0202694758 /NCGR_PEP_ID=MMETSP1385-20130828/8536_1 /ASSEMBLY_ACC=CAM_ASM_000861 /TAXON_ID=933848 /ORGANISM="Elphidium margaritaceum" /LENGTH=347 /DNA_ID=CAMNT_0049350659 /DNA_START=621 /DNA_END=1664 /DNA_ORIENTATION=-